jgi:hypothetical protein
VVGWLNVSVAEKKKNGSMKGIGKWERTKESVVLPSDTLVDVGSGIRETLCLTGLATEQAVEVGSDLVRLFGGKRGKMAS